MLNYRETFDGEEGRDEFDVHMDQIEAMLAVLSKLACLSNLRSCS